MKKNGAAAGRRWERPLVSAAYFTLRALVLLTMAAQFFNRNYENVLLCLLTLGLFMLPSALERRLRIELPDTLEIVVLLFIYAAEIMGEIQSWYVSFPYWDLMLHTMNGFLCAAIGFALVDLLNREERVSLALSPFFMAATAFCFSMTVGVLWEFFEFTMDRFFALDMQKDSVISSLSSLLLAADPAAGPVSVGPIRETVAVLEDGRTAVLGLGGYLDPGLTDTMTDLMVNFAGAAIFSAAGGLYVKGRGRGSFVRLFIPRVLRRGPRGAVNSRAPRGAYCSCSASKNEEVTTMMDQTNPSIKCSVNSCAHHKDQRCTLNEIQVGCCQNNVGECKETECASFLLGDHGTSCGCH